MKTHTRFGLVIAFATAIAATAVFANDDAASGQMMQNGGMMGGGMSGMQGMMQMMQMMQKMGPMMEACTEMIQAMTDHMGQHDQPTDEG